jgi:N-acetylmuramoyl-L-alanine amidase
VGKSGLLEKEVTLDIAVRLKELLKKEEGLSVILTRETDVLVPLEERTQIANQSGADLFISIHTNSFRKRSVRGCETFFLATAKNDQARAAAALENSSVRFELAEDESRNLADLEFILMDLVQSEYLKESSDLAAMIQKRLKKMLSIPDRGVSQAGFVVLNKAYMPAVLVETAFISNRKDEKLLKKGSFRQKIARAILESVRDFKSKYESAR